jgi:DDE_Tnp_1-associated/Transposase DDE domain
MQSVKQKQKNLYEMFLDLKDHRRAQGRMHELRLVLILTIMATMSGFHGLRAIGDFIKKNEKELVGIFEPKKSRLPSYLTVGRVLANVDFDRLTKIFHAWTIGYVKIEDSEWIAIDGKAIGGTVSGQDKKQKFISLVSVFSAKQKQILRLGRINNGKESEIPKVRELIKMLDLQDVVYTLDALHCQKKTVKAIVASGNNYCIGVKGNQKKLHAQIKKT